VGNLERSQEFWARAQRVIPLGTQTLSKSPTQFVQGVTPIYLERGRGAHVWDVDGNEYVDYPMALGPVILGYTEPVVDDAVRAQLANGITFTLMHPLEVEVAERIVALCPGVEAVRFGKSGSDALSGAVRAARAYTGRDRVLVAGYHGWHDWYIGTTTRNSGVPDAVAGLTKTFVYNDLDDLERQLSEGRGEIAAVVLEPSGAESPGPGYLQGVIDLGHRHGAVVVFDEIITGFRLAPGGARQRYGVQPDVSCYGKALGNGMPVSAVAGTWEIMREFEQIFVSGTHGGEALSLAAAAAVLDALADGVVLAGIRELGKRMLEGIEDLIERHDVGDLVRVGGEPERAVVGFAGPDYLITRSWVQQCAAEHAILFNGSMFICARHSVEDIDRALAAFDEAFSVLATEADLAALLKGPPVQAVFRTP
jgi:glutamate-1-semialdehyde 2,1-aminomutase